MTVLSSYHNIFQMENFVDVCVELSLHWPWCDGSLSPFPSQTGNQGREPEKCWEKDGGSLWSASCRGRCRSPAHQEKAGQTCRLIGKSQEVEYECNEGALSLLLRNVWIFWKWDKKLRFCSLTFGIMLIWLWKYRVIIYISKLWLKPFCSYSQFVIRKKKWQQGRKCNLTLDIF